MKPEDLRELKVKSLPLQGKEYQPSQRLFSMLSKGLVNIQYCGQTRIAKWRMELTILNFGKYLFMFAN